MSTASERMRDEVFEELGVLLNEAAVRKWKNDKSYEKHEKDYIDTVYHTTEFGTRLGGRDVHVRLVPKNKEKLNK